MGKQSKGKGKAINQGFRWALIGAIALASILIGTQLWANNRTMSEAKAGPAYYEGIEFDRTALGSPNAPVTVVEFYDFQCPACQSSAEQIVKPLVEKYVSTGQVRFIYYSYPILGPESIAAAEAAYCAMVQDAFWPYQDVLWSSKATGNRGAFSQANLISMARQVGLNEDEFRQCLVSPAAAAYVQASYQYAVDVGLPGTPSFFVNNVSVPSSRQAIEQAIEGALSLAEQQ